MEQSIRVKAAVKYFKDDNGFERLFLCFKEKYASLGYVGGTVKISNLQEHERNALSGFLSRDLKGQNSVSVSADKFQKSLNNSRFEGTTVSEIVEAYFDGEIKYKKDIKIEEDNEKREFFKRLLSDLNLSSDTKSGLNIQSSAEDYTLPGTWLKTILKEKISPYNKIMKEYHEDKEKLFQTLQIVLRAICTMEKQEASVRLPVFAAQLTGDPHYFDKNGGAYNYLLHSAYYTANKKFLANANLNSEQEAEVLYNAGILIDDVSNSVTCYGICGLDFSQKEHAGLRGFFDSGEPVILSLANLYKLAKVWAVDGEVYVIENPSIFAEMIDCEADSGQQGCHKSYICSAGQANLAVLVLLDMLVKNGTQLYYSGDFDPEGLMIAQRLKWRYGEKIIFRGYTVGNYLNSLSGKSLSETRLKQLDKIEDKELSAVAEVMKKVKKAGYQESVETFQKNVRYLQ